MIDSHREGPEPISQEELHTGILGSRSVTSAIALVTAVYVASLLFLPRAGLWTLDNSVKYLQVQALSSSGLRTSALNWAGGHIVSPTQCSPIPSPFGVVENGQLQGIYSPFFALVSVLPFKLFGFRGLVLLPLLATLLMFVGLTRLARSLGLDERGQAWVVVVAGLATPVWFYAVMFWEHSLAVCLVVWSLVSLVEYGRSGRTRALVLAAMFGSLAVYFRDDLYIALPLLAGFSLLVRQATWREGTRAVVVFAALAGLSLCPLWLINAHYTGRPLGFHLTEPFGTLAGFKEFLELRPIIFHHLFIALHTSLSVALILAAPLLCLLVLQPRVTGSRSRWIVPCAAAWAAIPLLLGFWELSQGESPVSHLKGTNSLFFASPLLVLGLLRLHSEENQQQRETGRLATLLGRLVLAYAFVYALLTPQPSSAGGIHWGNRFLLVAYPLLALLAVATITKAYRSTAARRGVGFLMVALVGSLSFSAQIYSINLAVRTERFFDRLNTSVEADFHPAVLTDTWWIPLQLYRLFPSRPIFLVSDQSCWQALEPKLKLAKIEKLLDVRWEQTQDRPPVDAKRIGDDGLDFYGVTLQEQNVRNFLWRQQRATPF